MRNLLLTASCVLCAVAASAAPETQRSVSRERLMQALVDDLGAEDYAAREQAEQSLRRLGSTALSALEQAAQTDDPEIRTRARGILQDVRLGLGPDWPAAAAAQVRAWDSLDERQRRNALRDLPQMVGIKAIPFMLLRMEKGSDYEARYALRYLQNTLNRPEAWHKVMALLPEPRCDRHREVLTWARAQAGAPAEGAAADKGAKEDLVIHVAATVKDNREKELRQALAACRMTMTMNVQPEGLRLFDQAPATIGYDRTKKEITVLLNGTPVCKAIPSAPHQAGEQVAVRTLDCIYIFALDPETGKAEQKARFEKDYKVTFKARGDVAALGDIKVTVNRKPYLWQNLLQGAEFDYLPARMEIKLQGTDPNGKRVTREYKIETSEPPLFAPADKETAPP